MVVAAVWTLNVRTIWGYEMKAIAPIRRHPSSPAFRSMQRSCGLRWSQAGLAGFAGVVEVIGVKGDLTLDLSPGYGYSGIVVAMLAALHPLAVVPASVFVAGIFVGADAMSRAMTVSSYIAEVITAVSLLSMLVATLFLRYRVRWLEIMEVLDILASVSFWVATVRIATPLVLGTLGELICERAGVLNLGIEGIMTVGAMVGWIAVYQGADLWAGVALAALGGALFGLIHGILTCPLALSQHVTGLGVTLLEPASAITRFASCCPRSQRLPESTVSADCRSRAVRNPDHRPAVFEQTALTYLAFASVLVVAYVLFATPIGLAVRMVGENPQAAEGPGDQRSRGASGRPSWRAAPLMAIGGCFLTLSAFNAFYINMIRDAAGSGIALVIFASWRPGKALLAALLFAGIDAFQLRLQQQIGAYLPYQVFLMLPYAVSIIALMLVSRRASYPKALMVPYVVGER